MSDTYLSLGTMKADWDRLAPFTSDRCQTSRNRTLGIEETETKGPRIPLAVFCHAEQSGLPGPGHVDVHRYWNGCCRSLH